MVQAQLREMEAKTRATRAAIARLEDKQTEKMGRAQLRDEIARVRVENEARRERVRGGTWTRAAFGYSRIHPQPAAVVQELAAHLHARVRL